jgi:hypothetical protein
MLALKGKHVLKDRILCCGKTGQVEHRLDPMVCQMLRNLAGDPENYVFRDWGGKQSSPSTPSTLGKRVTRIMHRAGLKGEKLAPHTLRHSSASLVMKASNGNISLVQALLQHANQKTTALYIHDWQTDLQQTVSPLALINDAIKSPIDPNQPLLLPTEPADNSTSLVASNQNIIYNDNKPDILIEAIYLLPAENTNIRPLLKTDDILLIRRAFICLAQFSQVITDAKDSRTLYRRILRKSTTKNEAQPIKEADTYIIK